MKYIVVLFCLLPLMSSAQLTGDKFRNGYIIDNSGTRYEGLVRILPGNDNSPATVEFKEEKRSKREAYTPGYVRTVKIESDSFTVLKKLPMPRKKVREADFAKVIIKGPGGNVYVLEYTVQKSSGHASTEYTITEENSKYYIQINGKIAMLTPSNFKDVAVIVGDCADLKARITSRKLKVADIEKVASEYQSCTRKQ